MSNYLTKSNMLDGGVLGVGHHDIVAPPHNH